MSYLVLARKWRPNNFDEIIGQEHITRTLKNAIKQGKIHHAFLFTGSRGVGKTTSARVLAKALCCENGGPTPDPCGVCSSCRAIAAGNSVDVMEIDGASNTGVDSVRDLRDKVQYRPQHARYKIYIIDEVHMLSTAAFNALLKTLEEPPEHVKFIFATTESHKIPQTILSRCQRYDFKLLSENDIVATLEPIIAAEGYTAEDGVLRMVARLARGSMRDSQSLLDRVLAYAEDKVLRMEDARTVLGIVDSRVFHTLGRALVERRAAAVFDAVDELCRYGHDLRQFGQEFVEYLRSAVLAISHPEARRILDLPEAEADELIKTAKMAEPVVWTAWFDLMIQGQEILARSEQPRCILEMTLAKMLQVADLKPLGQLAAELAALARGGALPSGGSSGPSAASGRPAPSSGSSGAGWRSRTAQSAGPAEESPVTQRASEEAYTPPPRPARVFEVGRTLGPGQLPEWWIELVDRVKSEDRLLWGVLRQVGVAEHADHAIIEYEPGNGLAEKINDPALLTKLSLKASELLDRTYLLQAAPKGSTGVQAVSIEEQRRNERNRLNEEARGKAEGDPLLKAVREEFGHFELEVKARETI